MLNLTRSTMLGIVLFSLGACLTYFHILILNITPSVPKGFYLKQSSTTIARGDLVAICLTPAYQRVGIAHHYLERGTTCDGAAPLIKQVLAIPGDTLMLANHSMTVNGIQYPYATCHYDTAHRPLKSYPRGTYVSHGYWLIGSHDSKSWDSRYWGEIAPSQIRAKLKPLLTW